LGQSGALRHFTGTPAIQHRVAPAQSDKLGNAFTEQKSGSQVTGEGTVTKLLSDDNEGSRHQRFILTPSFGPNAAGRSQHRPRAAPYFAEDW
jgi:hypothetical protein